MSWPSCDVSDPNRSPNERSRLGAFTGALRPRLVGHRVRAGAPGAVDSAGPRARRAVATVEAALEAGVPCHVLAAHVLAAAVLTAVVLPTAGLPAHLVRGSLEEPRRDEADHHGAAEEHRRLLPREPVRLADHALHVGLAEIARR